MNNNRRRNWRLDLFHRKMILLVSVLLLANIVSACSGSNGGNSSPTNTEINQTGTNEGIAENTPEEKELIAVKQVTNWFAEPEHGGLYAALVKGFYEEAGLDMTIEPGGPQVSATSIVSSGQAEFGMTQADNLLIAREQGIPIVGIAALFQTNPQGLIFHKDQNLTDFSQLEGRTVYVAPGSGYWEYIKTKYDLEGKVNEMTYTGSLVNFINDPTSLTQAYITAEPYALDQQGIDNGILLNADSGYNPYANLLFTTEKMIEENPELVRAFVEASIKGWDYYKTNYEEINPYIHEKNPDMSLEQMKYGAEHQMDLVYGGDAESGGVGIMTEERWSTLQDQLLEIGLIENKEDLSNVFTNEFLPGQ